MKKILVVFLAIVLLSVIWGNVLSHRESIHNVYLPFVSNPRVFVIDCMNGDGNFIECP